MEFLRQMRRQKTGFLSDPPDTYFYDPQGVPAAPGSGHAQAVLLHCQKCRLTWTLNHGFQLQSLGSLAAGCPPARRQTGEGGQLSAR